MDEQSAVNVYFNSNNQGQKTYFKDILSRITIQPGFKCLDIGCGTGNAAADLAAIVGEFGRVVGIDPDKMRLKQAVEMYGQHKNISFVCEKSVGFPYVDGGYDVVLSNAVLHWIPTEEKLITFRRVYESMKEGGVFAAAIIRNLPVNLLKLVHFCPEDSKSKFLSNFHLETSDFFRESFCKIGFKIEEFENVDYEIPFDGEMKHVQYIDATAMNGKLKLIDIYKKHNVSFDKYPDGRIKYQTNYFRIILRK